MKSVAEQLAEQLADVMAERDAYRARVVALEAALKPFADKAAEVDATPFGKEMPNRFGVRTRLEDCRLAHNVLYSPIATPIGSVSTPAPTVEVLHHMNPPVVFLPAAHEGQG